MKEKLKAHVKKNKPIYIGTAVGVAGFVGGAVIARKNVAIVLQYKPESSPVTLTQVVELVRRGHPGMVIKDNVTGEIYASLNRAAQATGLTRHKIVQDFGSRFEYLGDAS